LVTQGSRYRAALTCEVNSHEKAIPVKASGVASTLGQPGTILGVCRLGTRGVPVDFWYIEKARGIGDSVLAGPLDLPSGKIAVLGDPQGAAFAIFEGETDE
jgi:fermentation-respiration switch protein FrsA (DUF1100 family)